MSAARDSGRAKHFLSLGEAKKRFSRQPTGAGLASRDESDACDVMPKCAHGDD